MRHVQRATVIITAIAAAFLLFIGGAGLRLLLGPISLGAFSETIEDVLNRSVSGAVVRFDQVVLEWSQPDHRINIIVLGTKIFDLNGHIIAQAPKADLDFDALALLSGRVRLKNFGLIGLQLTGMRAQDGSIRLGFGRDQNDANFLESLRKILKDSSSGSSALESVSLQHARVAFMDEPTGLFIVLPDARFELQGRADGGFDGLLIAAAEISGSPLRIEARAQLRDDGTPKTANFRVTGFSVGALSQNSSKLAAVKPYALIADISGDLTFDSNGAVSDSTLRATGGGSVNIPALGDRINISHFDLKTAIDPHQHRLAIQALTFESDRASFRAAGTIDASWDDNGIARLAGQANATTVQVKTPQLSASALALPNLSFRVSYDRDARQIMLDRLSIDTGPVSADLSGVAHFDERGLQDIALTGDATPMSVTQMLGFWPPGLAEGAREWIAANVPRGQLGPLRITANIPAGAFDAPALPDDALEVSFPFQGLTATYLRGMTPITNAIGSGALHGDSFRLVVDSANVGPLALSNGEIAIPELHISGTTARITAHAQGSTANVLRLIDEQPLGYPKRFGINPATVEGRSAVDLDFQLPMLKDLPWEQVRFIVNAKATGLGLPVAGRKLDGANVDFIVGSSSLRASGNGRFAAVPVRFLWNENFENSQKSTRLDVSGVASDIDRQRLGVSLPSWITGPSPFSLTLLGNHFRFTDGYLSADLTRVAADFPGLGVKKPAGLSATANAQISIDSAGVMSLPDFVVRSNAVNLHGALAMAPGGKMRSLALSQFQAGADDFAMTLIPSERGYAVTIQGNTLDIRHLTGLDRATPAAAQESSSVQDPISIRGQVQRLILSQRADLHDVILSVALGANDRLNAFDLQAQGPANTPLTGHMALVKGVRTLDINSDNAGSLIDSVFNFGSVKGGKISARITFPETGLVNAIRRTPQPDYEGTITLTNVVLTDQPFLARLFAAGSLDGPLRLLQGQGISLSNVVIPFSARGHNYMISDGRAAGVAIGGTFTGAFDRDTGKVDISGTLVPVFGLNNVLSAIPVFGNLVTSRKGEGILGLTYQMKGNIAEPSILVNPLSMFTPGILRRIFEFGPPKPPAVTNPPAAGSPSR